MSMRNQSVLAMRGPGSMEILPASTWLPDVHGEGAVAVAVRAGCHHHLAALAVLLGGLEHHADLAVDVVGHMAQDLQGPQHHGDVAIVAAACMKPSLTDANSSSVRSVTAKA